MSDPIVRLYASLDHAKAAVARLTTWGYSEDAITVVTPASRPPANAPASSASQDPVLSTIMARYVLRAHAEVYAAKVHAGNTLVIVEPFFGSGMIAVSLLDESGQSIDTGVVVEPKDPLPMWDDAAPLSSALRLPTLLRKYIHLTGGPLLTRSYRTPTGMLGMPLLHRSGRTYLTRSLPRQASMMTPGLMRQGPILSRNPILSRD
jgi:hypothetical protein